MGENRSLLEYNRMENKLGTGLALPYFEAGYDVFGGI
jgi:hypothetical protein